MELIFDDELSYVTGVFSIVKIVTDLIIRSAVEMEKKISILFQITWLLMSISHLIRGWSAELFYPLPAIQYLFFVAFELLW